jgi:hypothetical protein
MIAPPYAISDSTASEAFTSISGSSGRVDTIYGSAEGSAAGGATGSQAGTVLITAGGLGTLKFDGTTTASGTGSFGAGFSPIQFNTVTTEIPGVAIVTLGSPKTGGNAISAPTFVTTVVPVSTGPTSGFGSGAGALSVVSTTTGTLRGVESQCLTKVLDLVVVRPRTLEAVWEVGPTYLVPLVDLDRELPLVSLLLQVAQSSIPLMASSLLRVAPLATSTTRHLVSLAPPQLPIFPPFPE